MTVSAIDNNADKKALVQDLKDALGPLTDSEEIKRVAARILDEYADVDSDRQLSGWQEGVALRAGQTAALSAAVKGPRIESALEILINTATDYLGAGSRAAFYLADPSLQTLSHIVGMPPDYPVQSAGAEVGPESLACGLAAFTGEPVITPDVRKEPLWKPWLWLAEKFDYRGSWSFPIRSSQGRSFGALAFFFSEPREPKDRDLEFASLLAETASTVLTRFFDAEAHRAAERDSAHLAAIVQSSDDAIIAKSLDGIVRSWNLAAERVFGFTAEEAIGRPITMIIPDDRLNEESRILSKLRRGERIDHFETVRRRKDGTLVDLSLTISPVRDHAGNIIGASKIARDITTQKRNERNLREAFREAQILHRLAMDLSQPGEAPELYERIVDAALEIMRSSFAVLRMLYPAPDGGDDLRLLAASGEDNELPDFAVWRRVHADSAMAEVLATHERVIVKDFENTDRFGNDRELFLPLGIKAIQSTPLISRSGEVLGLITTHWREAHEPGERELRMFDVLARHAADLLERVRAEDAVRQSEERLRTLVDRSPFGIYLVDADFRIAQMNESSQKGAFVNVRPVIGRRFDDAMRILWPEDVAKDVADIFRRTMETGEPYFSKGFVNPRADTDEVEGYEFELHQFTMHDGRKGVICYFYDSTELRTTQQELEEARKAAETANRAKDNFIATLSHELRTPMTAMMGWTDILLRKTYDDEEVVEGLNVIKRNVKAQHKLIEDLLDVSRIVLGKLQFEFTECDLREIISAAVHTLRHAAETRGIELVVKELDSAGCIAVCDPSRIQQVVWNLLSNAIKFTPTGGRVEIETTRSEHEITIEIRDNGIGIDPELQPFLFERFRQADSTSRRKYGGLGLGLSIVKHIVEAHGGSVSVFSEGEGKGSAFTIRLPIKAVDGETAGKDDTAVVEAIECDDSEAPDRPSAADHDLKGVNILVVDDDDDGRNLVEKLLRDAGASVTTASSAGEALDILSDGAKNNDGCPDLIISDIGMPEIDGFDLLRAIKEKNLCSSRLRAVALTAFVQKDQADEATRAGFDAHVPKPVDSATFLSVLKDLLEDKENEA